MRQFLWENYNSALRWRSYNGRCNTSSLVLLWFTGLPGCHFQGCSDILCLEDSSHLPIKPSLWLYFCLVIPLLKWIFSIFIPDGIHKPQNCIIAGAIATTTCVSLIPEYSRFHEFTVAIILWLVPSALADIAMSCFMVWYLVRVCFNTFAFSLIIIWHLVRQQDRTGVDW